MACFDHGKIVELKTRQTVSLPDVRGATLRVARGTLWITQQDDTQDIVLRAGDTWTVERNGLTIMEAQGDVSLRVIGRRIEGLLTRRGHRRAQSTPWTWARDAIADLFTRPVRGPAPYY